MNELCYFTAGAVTTFLGKKIKDKWFNKRESKAISSEMAKARVAVKANRQFRKDGQNYLDSLPENIRDNMDEEWEEFENRNIASKEDMLLMTGMSVAEHPKKEETEEQYMDLVIDNVINLMKKGKVKINRPETKVGNDKSIIKMVSEVVSNLNISRKENLQAV